MRALLQAIASALCSWLSYLRGQPAAHQLKEKIGANPDVDASYGTGADVATVATQPSAEGRATENLGGPAQPTTENPSERDEIEEKRQEIRAVDDADCCDVIESVDEEPHGPAERATGHDDRPQLAEAAAIDEGEDLPTGDASKETGIVPGAAQGVSDGGKCALHSRQPVVGPVVESYEGFEQPSEDQETDDAAKAAPSVEPLMETLGQELVDHTRRLAGEEVADTAAGDGDGGSRADVSDANASPKPAGLMSAPTAPRRERRRTPQYRAPVGGPPLRQRSSQSQARPHHAGSSPGPGGPATIDVRVIFQHGGYCMISLLPQRLIGLPERIVVSSAGGDVELLALQDQWYQDVVPDNLPELLREGLVWEDSDTGQEWRLSGREVFVLAPGTTHRGFVSCPRLSLGRNHVVLCTAKVLAPVEDALRAAECDSWSRLGEDDGAPSGWRVLREVVPRKSVPLSNNADILNILRPLPEIEVALEGGIRLAYNTWLLGYPPAIHVYGYHEHTETVLIDGQEAAVSERHGYTAPGWDVEGDHQVWCSNTNRSYSLVRCETNWTYWPAYSFAVSSSGGDDHEFEVCGPLVSTGAMGGRSNQRQVVQVPATNPVLLGACPGEVFFARPRLDLRGAQCLGLPRFDPVWAIPPDTLLCDKRTNRILLVGESAAAGSSTNREPSSGRRDLKRWCLLILDANRKGLSVEPASPATDDLWREYKQVARRLWRRLR